MRKSRLVQPRSEATRERVPVLRPITATERIELLDVLRGIALFAILIVNFRGQPAAGTPLEPVDNLWASAITLLAVASFYPLFSMLFGYGFALQLGRAYNGGRPITAFYLRRMTALFAIGTAHALLIWRGDILVTYALFGMLLLPLWRLGDRWLLLLATIPLVLRLSSTAPPTNELGDASTNVDAVQLVSPGGHDRVAELSRKEAYAKAVSERWLHYERKLRRILSPAFVRYDVISFFIVGLIIGRRRILQHVSQLRRTFVRTAVLGLTAAAIGNAAIQLGNMAGPIRGLCGYAADYGLTAFYFAGISYLFTMHPRTRGVLRLFGAPGRLALTVYITQSLVMTLLFADYGLRLPEPSTTIMLVLHAGFFLLVQVPLCIMWSGTFKFGPAEWLWRSMSYGKLQPMR